jgi:imidazolonepropionase-like amidohydrolase
MTRRIIVPQEHLSSSDDGGRNASPMPNSYRPSVYSVSLGARLIREAKDDDKVPSSGIEVSKKLVYTLVYADLLIPGDGEPLSNAALVSEGKLIVWVGDKDELPKKYIDKARRTYEVPYLMPGLWDVHIHFGGDSEEEEAMPAYLGFIAGHPASAGARLARACWESLQWGYTSVRDVAGYGCEIAKAIEDGTIVGPNIYSSGGCLSQLAGHGDVFSLPAGDVLQNLGISNIRSGHFGTTMSVICDGPDECRRAVRLQIRRGAKCIKVLASGGVLSSDDNPLYAQFSPAELEAIVDEATRMERSVAAHVHGKPGIIAAVKAGVTTVEHVSFADEECIDLIKEKGTIYVATRCIVKELLETGGKGMPKKIWEKAKLCGSNHDKAYKLAVAAGCTIALGTDSPPGYSKMATEIEYAVEAGLSNLEALKAATANGVLTVKGQVPQTGQLKVGYEADFIGLLQNPVENVKILQCQENIKWVWKGGQIFKGPGVGPWGGD